MLSHAGKDGLEVSLPFLTESRGTRRLIGLLMRAFDAIDRGSILFVDELDASMHTLLSMKLLELFSDNEINRNGAQLVATTHDTNILCLKTVRRDQIWFVEKDSDGATSVYPLTNIRTRNTDNLEKGYLQGRFGAIPFLGSTKELWSRRANA
jgi:AAA15 family ATPase/GTPase